MKLYFVDKMRNVIIASNRPNPKISSENNLTKKLQQSLSSNNLFSYNIGLKKPDKLFEYRNNKMDRDLILNEKMLEIHKNSKSSIFDNLNKFEMKNLKYNQIISKQLKHQNFNMLKRLQKRRQTSVTISTGSSSFIINNRNQKKNLKDMNIIEELEFFEHEIDNGNSEKNSRNITRVKSKKNLGSDLKT